MTQYYREHLVPVRHLFDIGAGVYQRGDSWYVVTKQGEEVTKVPIWVARSLLFDRELTGCFGPYMFYNNYEQSANAQYLIGMFKYPNLTPAASAKREAILESDREWVIINKEFMEALNEREKLIAQHACSNGNS